jgi:ACS family hexuronate transporter-like MFS transporter
MMPPWQRQLLLLLIISAGILNYIDRQVIAILKPMLQQSLGWSDADYGDLTSIFQLAAALAYLFTGWLVDRIGWKWSNPLAVGSWSLAAAAHALISSFGQFALARVALGATEALGTPTAIKSIATLFNPAERSQALGWMNAANSFGAIAGPLTIPLIALAYGWRATFLAIGGLGLLWVALWLLAARGVPARSGVPAPAAEPVSWLATLRDRRNIAIIGAKMLSDQVWWLLLFWAPDFFHRMFHLDMQDFGLPLAILYAAAGLGSVLGGLGSARLIRAGMTPVAAHQRVLLVCAVVATPIALAPHVANQCRSHWRDGIFRQYRGHADFAGSRLDSQSRLRLLCPVRLLRRRLSACRGLDQADLRPRGHKSGLISSFTSCVLYKI